MNKTMEILARYSDEEVLLAAAEIIKRYNSASDDQNDPYYEAKKKIIRALKVVGFREPIVPNCDITNYTVDVAFFSGDDLEIRIYYRLRGEKIDETSEILATIHVSPESRIINVDETGFYVSSSAFPVESVHKSVRTIVDAISFLQ